MCFSFYLFLFLVYDFLFLCWLSNTHNTVQINFFDWWLFNFNLRLFYVVSFFSPFICDHESNINTSATRTHTHTHSNYGLHTNKGQCFSICKFKKKHTHTKTNNNSSTQFLCKFPKPAQALRWYRLGTFFWKLTH